MQSGKEELKSSLFQGNMIKFVENHKDFTKNKVMSKVTTGYKIMSKVTGYNNKSPKASCIMNASERKIKTKII